MSGLNRYELEVDGVDVDFGLTQEAALAEVDRYLTEPSVREITIRLSHEPPSTTREEI